MAYDDNSEIGTNEIFRRLNRAEGRGRVGGGGREMNLSALESRLLYTVGNGPAADDEVHTDFPAAIDPVAIQETLDAQAGEIAGAGVPVSGGVPVFNSNPGANVRLIIDFDGAAAMSWGSYSVPTSPAYDQDGDPTTFNSAELASINEIVMRVAEKFSPFNINVTTVDDGGPYLNKQALRIVVGGTGAWVGAVTGGVAYIGGFYNSSDNTGFAFSGNLSNGYAKYTAEAVAHEAGHAFGLQHQSVWNGSTLSQEYNPGTSATAPVMGVTYYATRGLWWTGTPSNSSTGTQYDLATLTNSSNGFGLRTDDHGNSSAAATALAVSSNAFTASGVITQNTDADYFSFTMGSGTVSLSLGVAQYGAMLDGSLFVYDSQGNLVGSKDTSSLGETLSLDLPAGVYYVSVASKGGYGDIGQYTLAGSVTAGPGIVTVATPSGATATAVSGVSRVTVTWMDSSTNESAFLIERSTDGQTWSELGTVGPNVTTYNDDSVSGSTTYYYRVQAYNAYAMSGYSGTVSALSVPTAPAGVTTAIVSATQVNLSWSGTAGATGYVIERSTNGTTWTQAGTTNGSTNYSDTGLTAGTQYQYRVRAANASGNSAASATATGLTLPAAPASVVATAASAVQIGLTWTAVTGASSYVIERSADGSNWAQIGTALSASFTNTGLTAATTYYYRVLAVNASGNSAYSSSVNTVTRPAAPTVQSTVPASATQITVTWAAVAGATSYQVDRSLNGSTWTQVGTPTGTSYDDTGLSGGTRYYYRVRAVNTSGASVNSSTVNTYTLPAAPAAITGTVVSGTQVNLTWSASTGATSYTLERSADGTNWATLTTANVTSYNDTAATAGTSYTYRVKANNTSGASTHATTTALTKPAVPSSVSATVGTNHVALTWSAVTGAASYIVERSTNGTTWTQAGTPTTASYTDTQLTAGTQYYYRVSAVNASGSSTSTASYGAMTLSSAPGTPTVTATSAAAVTVTWTGVAGATSYLLERSTDNATWTQVTSTAGLTYSNTDLSAGTRYYYRVRATSPAGNSGYSVSGSTYTMPGAPTGLAVSSVTASQVVLNWASVTSATGYFIERSADGSTWSSIGSGAATTYTDTGRSANTHYFYRVRAGNGSGNSGYSGTLDALTAPLATSSTTATPVSASRVDVSWSAVVGATLYAVERSTDGANWTQLGTAGTPSYSDTAATAGTAYQYRVRATNAGGYGTYGTAATTLTLPGAPAAVNVSHTSSTAVSISWTAVSSASSYQVDRSADGETWVAVGTTAGTTTTDTGLGAGSTYYWRVRAVNASGVSGYSSGTNAVVPPTTPAGLAVSSATTTSLEISWQPSSGATGYTLERSLNGSSWSVVTTTGVGVTEFTDTGLSAGTSYYYRVTATNPVGSSAASAGVSSKTLPAAPSFSAANAGIAGQVSLTWGAVTGAATYTLERSTDGLNWTVVTTTAGTSYSDGSVASGTSYSYRLRATNTSGDSAYGATATALTLAAVPAGVSAEPKSTTRVDVSWSAVTGAASYRVERSVDGTNWTVVGTTAGTSLSDTAASAGTAYTYRVAAVNATGSSAGSTPVAALTLPAAPAAFAGALSNLTSVTLSWATTTGASSYVIERSANGGTWQAVGTQSGVGFVDGGLTPGVTYSYKVRASNASGYSSYTAVVSATPPVVMTDPTGLSVTDVTSSGAVVSWEDNSDNEQGFAVQRSADGGTTWVTVGTTAADVANYHDAFLAGGTTYAYRVRAYWGVFTSGFTGTESVTTKPAAPAAFAVTSNSVTQLALNWAASVGSTSYEVERSADGVSGWESLATVNSPGYLDSGLLGGARHYYRVRALSAVGESGYSAVGTNVTLPAAPAYVVAVATPDGPVALAWAEVTGGVAYVVERSADGESWSQLVTATGGFFTDDSVSGGTTYYYRVVALGEAGASGYGPTAVALTVPDAPTEPHALIMGPGQVNVSWAAMNGTVSYLLERSTDGVNWEEIGETELNSYTDEGLLPNARYYYRARAINETGLSAWSDVMEASTPQTTPDAPSALAVTQVSANTLKLSWENSATNTTGFRVEYSQDGGKSWKLAGNLAGLGTTVQVTGLLTGDNYRFRVLAYNEMGLSKASNSMAAKPLGAKPGTTPGTRVLDVKNVKTAMPGLTKKLRPEAAGSLKARAYSTSAVQLTWADRSDNELGFRVEYSLDGVKWVLAGYTSTDQTGCRVTNLQKGKSYWFRITAYNLAGDSAKGAITKATLPVKPPAKANAKPSFEPDQDTTLNVLKGPNAIPGVRPAIRHAIRAA